MGVLHDWPRHAAQEANHGVRQHICNIGGCVMGKYKTVVIDPPWKQDIRSRGLSDGKNHTWAEIGKQRRHLVYDTLHDEAIRNMWIRRWADTDCHVFVWCTQVKMPIVYDILKSWGVRYRATMCWWKHTGPCSFHLYYDTEFLLYGTLGAYFTPDRTLKTFFDAPRSAHSAKPTLVYDAIRVATPEPRIDIFARHRHDGFDAWGNQVQEISQTVFD